MPNYYRNRLTVLHDRPERVEEVIRTRQDLCLPKE